MCWRNRAPVLVRATIVLGSSLDHTLQLIQRSQIFCTRSTLTSERIIAHDRKHLKDERIVGKEYVLKGGVTKLIHGTV